MEITSINTNELLSSLTKTSGSLQDSDDFISFKDMLEDAVNNVVQTDTTAQLDAVSIVSGESDDLHTLTIDIAKADLALQTLVQIRNKALDAYNEIMRITL